MGPSHKKKGKKDSTHVYIYTVGSPLLILLCGNGMQIPQVSCLSSFFLSALFPSQFQKEKKKTCHSSWTARHGIDIPIEGNKNSKIFDDFFFVSDFFPRVKKKITHKTFCVTFFFYPFFLGG
jgi:hypothetical protein